MKIPILLTLLSVAPLAWAENVASESPITMQQLMREFEIQGGNWTFRFDEPVYARITCKIPSFPDAGEVREEVFISDSPSKEISLFFMDSPDPIGRPPGANQATEKAMKIKLSDCKATEGTRIVPYMDKFGMAPWVSRDGQRGDYRPAIAAEPRLGQEYVLNAYFMEGDPYEVTATICFVSHPADFEAVPAYSRKTLSQVQTTSD